MSKEIKIEITEQCTIYIVGVSDKFRIVQNRDNEFVIQKLFYRTQTKGYLWWKKTKILDKWKRVDKNGHIYYNILSKINDFKTYKTLDKAIKWIEDYNKYPIYH